VAAILQVGILVERWVMHSAAADLAPPPHARRVYDEARAWSLRQVAPTPNHCSDGAVRTTRRNALLLFDVYQL